MPKCFSVGISFFCFVVGLGAMSLVSCAHAPDHRFQLDEVRVVGNSALPDREIEEKLASRETPRFLGVFSGVIYDHQKFNRYVLESDLQRIERLYRSRGYYEAHARAARVFRSGNTVHVEIVVEEGPLVVVRRLDVHGLETLPVALATEVLNTARENLELGAAFEEQKLAATATDLSQLLADVGYATVAVSHSANVDLPAHGASVGFWLVPGEVCEFGAVTWSGLGALPKPVIARALGIKPGELYSESELQEAKRAVLELGVFSSVKVSADIEHAVVGPSGRPRVPIKVELEPSKLRSVQVGGGVQFDSLKSELHLSAGWQDQSFLGGLRKLQIEVRPGAIVYPTRVPSFETPERLLAEGRVRVEFRQPGFVEKRTNALLETELSIEPSLLSSRHDPGEAILGYRDHRFKAGLERSLRRLYVNLSENVQANVPFAYRGDLVAGLEPVLITYPALLLSLDLRDSRLEPRRGLLALVQLEAAGIVGDARDLKVRPEVRGYLPLGNDTVLALRGALGLLFPRNYGETVRPNALSGESGLPGTDEEVRRAWIRDLQLMFFRGLFAGGSGSNRGYGLREIGPHGVVPYYIPGEAADTLATTCPTDGAGERTACNLPLGGFTSWEASAELRHPLLGPLSGVVFVDTADVSPAELLFRWRPHLSVGIGFRFDTPVGPIRLDAGYRVAGLQAPSGARDEGTPSRLFGLPMAASFGIGEPF